MDCRKRGIRICFCKSYSCLGFFLFTLAPKSFYCIIFFFYQIYFLLIVSAPEITVYPIAFAGISFYPFWADLISPKNTNVLPCCQQIKIINQCISYPVIKKIPAVTFYYFFSEIFTITTSLVNYKNLCQQIKIAIHGIFAITPFQSRVRHRFFYNN